MGGRDKLQASLCPHIALCEPTGDVKKASRYDADFQSWNTLRIILYISSFKLWLRRVVAGQLQGRSGLDSTLVHVDKMTVAHALFLAFYEGWNCNSGNYLFTTDAK